MNNNSTKSSDIIRLMYLAPEVPALSATFVYNEILALKALGYPISIVSVHKPENSIDKSTATLLGHVSNLYTENVIHKLFCLFKIILNKPQQFFSALRLLIRDILSIGLFSRNSLGLCYRFFASTSLAVKIIENDIQHLHVHFAHVPTDIAMYAAKLTNIEFSIMAHANDIFQRGWLLKEKIERCKFFATISEYNQQYLSQFTKTKDKLKIIHCGVDQHKFITRKQQPKNSKYIFGFLGRLVEKKGVHILLQSITKLKETNNNFELQIVGDGPEKEQLFSIMENKHIEQHVNFLGKMPNSEVSKWLANLNCFVLPCVKDVNGDMDGIPVSLMEAMLMGVPVISTTISGIPELIIDDETGFLAKTESVEDLVEKMIQTMTCNPQKIDLITDNAVKHVIKHFDINKNAIKLSDYINE